MQVSLAQAVYRTICLFEVFQQPASAAEVQQFLLYYKAERTEVEEVLELNPRFKKSFNFYSRRESPNLIWQRFRQQIFARQFWPVVLRARKFFPLIPFVRQIFVAKDLAFGWPKQNSTLDLFVLTNPQRLFTTWFFFTLLLRLRRLGSFGARTTTRLKLAFFCASSQRDLSGLKIGAQDPYLAFWLANLIPIYGTQANDFFVNNHWLRKVFPNLRHSYPVKSSLRPNLLEKFLRGHLGDLLEARLRLWQGKSTQLYQKKQIKNSILLSKDCFNFENNAGRKKFLRKWQALCATWSELK